MGEKILYIILALLAAFIVITVIRAIFHKPKKVSYPELPKEKVDAQRAAKHISGAIQIPTVSYPEKEKVDWEQFKKFHKFLEEAYPLIHKNLKRELISEASLLYTWKGKNPDLKPIALLSHQDVVPISDNTEQDWTHPPFSGHNDGEFIWGRGAMDMKNHLICVMESVETLLEEGFEPECDVYLCFGHDEEVVASKYSGAKAIMNTLKDRGVWLDSVLDEGGAFLPLKIKGVIDTELAAIGVAEKGYADFEVTVKSKGGHSSQPPVHSGLGDLANVIKDLEGHQFKAKIPAYLIKLLNDVGKKFCYPIRLITCNLWMLKPLIKAVMKKIPFAACMIRTTTAVTMASGSPAANVLPQKSSVTINFRQMPGTTLDDVEKHIRKVVRKKDIDVTMLKGKEASKISPTDSRAFKIIDEYCHSSYPNSVVTSYLVMGGTDAIFYEPICDNIYRFSPFYVTIPLLQCTHATDERLPVKTIEESVGFFKHYIRTLASKEK